MNFCRICGNALIATCDKTQKSELKEHMGQNWTKTKPEFMWTYPTAKEQSDLCFYHQQRERREEDAISKTKS